jgi:hypothetical protein
MGSKIKFAKRERDLPEPSYVKAMVEINRQTARGAAIAGSAYLDVLLRNSIEKRMRPDPEIHDRLFENRGALQDFSARIQITYALGISGHRAYRDLCIIRRNYALAKGRQHPYIP